MKKHPNRCNGAGKMATLRIAALNMLGFTKFQSTCSETQAVIHDITGLLAFRQL
jgi:hypothetical protein